MKDRMFNIIGGLLIAGFSLWVSVVMLLHIGG